MVEVHAGWSITFVPIVNLHWMRHTFAHFLFILLLSNIIGVNAIRWIDSRVLAAGAPDSMVQVIESEDSTEESEESAPFWDTDGGGDSSDLPPVPCVHAAFAISVRNTDAFIRSISIRQLQLNLLNSKQVPARFILFRSYQGYLS